MKLDPVPMECAKCKNETTHSVSFTEHAKAADPQPSSRADLAHKAAQGHSLLR